VKFSLSGRTVKLIRKRSGSSANIHLRANHHMEEVGGWNLSPYEEDDHAKENLSKQLGYAAIVAPSTLDTVMVPSPGNEQPEVHWSQKCTTS